VRDIIRVVSKIVVRPLGKALISLVAVVVIVGLIFFHPTTSNYSARRGWIEFTGDQYNTYYVVTNLSCTPGESIGATSNGYSAILGGPPPTANVLPSGTQLYTIKNVNQRQAICVALDHGNNGYSEAVYSGKKPPK